MKKRRHIVRSSAEELQVLPLLILLGLRSGHEIGLQCVNLGQELRVVAICKHH